MKLLKFSALLLIASVAPALAQNRDVRAMFPNATVRTLTDGGMVITPPSSVSQPGKAHTNVKLFQPATGVPVSNPPFAGFPTINTPGSISCLYGLAQFSAGCNPYKAFALSKGGARTIAIVDAFNAPNAAADLATFSAQFNLPAANFQVVYADAAGNQTGTVPPYDAGWELEISLDIEWAHAMAPKAHIILVEAQSSSFVDMNGAEILAGKLVSAAGGGEVSNSWGSPEFAGETLNDGLYVAPGVVFLASSGDTPGTEYPCVSPNVVCVGGTTVNRDSNGNFIGQTAWSSGGGGSSAFENRPAFQNSIANIVGNTRGVPDVAAVADPNTGVYIYDFNAGGWLPIGGTSVAAPVAAGITNYDNFFRSSSNVELTYVYKHPSLFVDITQGGCGINNAAKGWDFCTGWGSPFSANSSGL